jgi:protein gp37
VYEGTKRDAILYSCGANKHGKARTNDDKRRAVTRLLGDREWGGWSNVEISRHCGVSESLVRSIRKAIFVSNEDSAPRKVKRGGTTYEMDTSKIGLPTQEALFDEPADDMDRAAIEATFPTQQPTVIDMPIDEVHLIEAPVLILTSPPGEPPPGKKTTFNRTNEMVDWAWWTWNPVTGCLHDCPYCYARDIAERLYPEKFEPTFHPDRLTAPYYTPLPAQAAEDSRANSVFVCSMADLFGKWVPQEWIEAVLKQVWANQQWNFLFLTKFPQRLAEIDWPPNAWVGTTVDEQYRVKIAEKAFEKVNATVRWLSCEPLREDLTFERLDLFDWVVIGGQSKSTREDAFQPPWAWVEHLWRQARDANCLLYWKPNLLTRPLEYPAQVGQVAAR